MIGARTAVFIFIFTALFTGRASAGAEWVEWIADAEVLYSSRDNINNAVNDPIKESEQVWTPSFSFGRINQLADFTRLIIKADLSAGFHNRFSGLDHKTVGATLAVRHKFGIGPQRWWVRASLSGANIDSNSKLRDGQQYVAGLTAGKRVHDRVSLFIGYTYDMRDGPDSPPSAIAASVPAVANLPGSVFDLKGSKLSAGIDVLITGRTLFVAGYSIREGDIVASCDLKTISWVINEIEAITDDDALPVCAYRAEAKTSGFTAGLSYAFYGGHAALNVRYEVFDSQVGAYSYNNSNLNASFNYSY